MKILFVISSLSSGGAERVLSILANKFSENYDTVVVTLSADQPFYPIHPKIKNITLDLMTNSANIFQSAIYTSKRIKALVKTFSRENPDIIISFMTHTNIIATIASKIARKKIIISERIAYDFYNSKLLYFARRRIYPLSNALVVQTQADKKHYNFVADVHVIYNPLNITSEIDERKKEKILLAVGRLDKQKGFDTLIEAYSKLQTDWKLFIAGEGNERETLKSLIERLHLQERVFLLGNRKDILNWYAKASIFVLSSKNEGFPNVLIEAMAMGCAVVSFDCPYGPAEIINDGIDGILVENQNTKQLSQAIQRLIEDEELRSTLANEAIKVRERYSIDKIANEWESLISKVVYE